MPLVIRITTCEDAHAREVSIQLGRCSLIIGSVIVAASASVSAQSPADFGGVFYVSPVAAPDGDGSRQAPFRTLAAAQAASAAGDTIHLLHSDQVLDGAITLKPGQKLLGLASDGTPATDPVERVRLTSTAELPEGTVVTLGGDNEIAGVHFEEMVGHAIAGHGVDYSGRFIHHATFLGNADEHIADERGQVYAVSFDASLGVRYDVRIEDSLFRDGEDLGAIRVFHSGDSEGRYHFARNEFFSLGGRPYFVRTRETSRVETVILDSVADSIGRGDRNSDSIIPYLMGRSEQVMLVRNYRFDNTQQVGNRSSTGIEGYIFGSPRQDEANWCDGCRLTLVIEDSVLRNAVTDPIQFSNSGRNSVLRYVIRDTKILGGTPRQGGGGISVNLQDEPDSGGSTTLLVEGTEVVGTDGFGLSVNNSGGGDALTVDLGGGPLGSRGGNRLLDNGRGPLRLAPGWTIHAGGNWWGGDEPVVLGPDDQPSSHSEVLLDPILSEDPL